MSKGSFIEKFQEVINMTIKSALSVVAITAALAGASFAQGMTINGAAVSDADMGAVQERCDGLANAAETESLTETSDDASDENSAETTANNDANAGNDAVTANPPAVNEAQNATSTIDLATIDLQACIDGGFVTQ
jgi:hypothetical protein